MHGENIGYAYGFWGAVVFNIVLFLVFALTFLVPKGKIEWRTFGVFTAFLIALFTEMFGIPLTIYILISIMGKGYPASNPFSHPAGHLLLTFLGLETSRLAFMLNHLISNGMIFGGFYTMSIGWKKIYAGAKEKKLVTDGIYSHVRHPQYSGLFLITLGLLIQWPTISTLFMEPFLLVAYYRLAMREEKEMEKTFGNEWIKYKEKTPAFIPKFGQWRPQ